jgi:hypothetical protein
MYKKLLALVHHFVHLRQGAFSRWYEGKLVSVDSDCLELQTFHADGRPHEVWTLALDTITEFSTGSTELNALALKVKWAQSPDHRNLDGLEPRRMDEVAPEPRHG